MEVLGGDEGEDVVVRIVDLYFERSKKKICCAMY
jgi:hypothetical protein